MKKLRNLVSRESLSTLVVVVGLFAFRSSLADQYVVPTGSMQPTIEPGDHIVVDKTAYDLRLPFVGVSVARTGEPRRGDVLVFRDPREPSRHLVKRLVGLPGDRVRVRGGFVELNGAALPTTAPSKRAPKLVEYDECFTDACHRIRRIILYANGSEYGDRYGDQTFTVPANSYFFLGDNRDNSADSREWGFAPRESIEGRAKRVLYSVRWDGWVPELQFNRTGVIL